MFSGEHATVRDDADWLGFELLGGRAIRQGDWKLISLPQPKGDGQWQLYRLSHDPGETKDLSADFPERKAAMIEQWLQYQQENGVVMPTR